MQIDKLQQQWTHYLCKLTSYSSSGHTFYTNWEATAAVDTLSMQIDKLQQQWTHFLFVDSGMCFEGHTYNLHDFQVHNSTTPSNDMYLIVPISNWTTVARLIATVYHRGDFSNCKYATNIWN